jgi:CheY-like chemotaxis protein
MSTGMGGTLGANGSVSLPTVLVTDDDPTSRTLVGAALEGHVGTIVEAENGLAAVGALDAKAFDLAIVDLDMPVMDGFGVIERARARAETRHLPIIVVTGRDDVVAIERAFALGATSFLCKPLNWNVFRHQVDYVLQVARVERETRVAKERAERLAALRDRALASLGNEIGGAVAKLAGLSGKGPSASLTEMFSVGERLHTVLARVKRASDILTGITAFEPESVEAREVAEEAVGMVQAALGAEAAGRVDVVSSEALRITCDRKFAAEALFEVMDNALAFSAPEQRVRLGIVRAPFNRIRFEVEDRGVGIPEAVLESGFETFRPAKAESRLRPGLGLGIAVVEAIVDRHGGHFGVMSELGRGTEVFLSFPAPAGIDQGEGKIHQTARIFETDLPKSADIPVT